MKKILSMILMCCIIVASIAAMQVSAIENGSGVKWGQVTLYSQATGTTSAVTTTAYTFDNVMKYGACDLISGITGSAGNVNFVIKGNQGSSSTLFDSTAYLLTSTNLASSGTATVMKTVTFASGVSAPFRTISATITSPTTTQLITINCSAIQ